MFACQVSLLSGIGHVYSIGLKKDDNSHAF